MFSKIVAINNAWQVRDDWDYSIFPEDFPTDRRPGTLANSQKIVQASDYVPANNQYGGIFYAGGTMAFTTGYWALAALRPTVLVFAGCDMVYPKSGATHFYGTGTADPLRNDLTLRNLEAKSARLMLMAAEQNCACVRVPNVDSRQVFPALSKAELTDRDFPRIASFSPALTTAKKLEKDAGYFVESGRYWKEDARFSVNKIDEIDSAWLTALAASKASTVEFTV